MEYAQDIYKYLKETFLKKTIIDKCLWKTIDTNKFCL
jgi:hypothetical protein